MIRLRRERPELADPDLGAVRVDFDEAAGWLVVHRGPYRVAVNLGRGRAALPLAAAGREVVAAFGAAALEDGAVRLGADSVAVVST